MKNAPDTGSSQNGKENCARSLKSDVMAKAEDAKTSRDGDASLSINDETSSSGSSDLTDDEEDTTLEEDSKKLAPMDRETITHPGTVKDMRDPDIHNRLASFFSQLAEQRSQPSTVDEVIEKGSDSGFEDEDEDEGQQYIELDLAMGVLSEEPEGKQFDHVDLPTNEDQQETSDSDSDEPLQKLTTIAKADDRTNASKSSKRKIEELG